MCVCVHKILCFSRNVFTKKKKRERKKEMIFVTQKDKKRDCKMAGEDKRIKRREDERAKPVANMTGDKERYAINLCIAVVPLFLRAEGRQHNFRNKQVAIKYYGAPRRECVAFIRPRDKRHAGAAKERLQVTITKT